MGFCLLGLESRGAAIRRGRLLQVAMRLEDVSEIVMGAGIRVVERDGAPKQSDSFTGLIELEGNDCTAFQRLALPRLRAQYLEIECMGLCETTCPPQHISLAKRSANARW